MQLTRRLFLYTIFNFLVACTISLPVVFEDSVRDRSLNTKAQNIPENSASYDVLSSNQRASHFEFGNQQPDAEDGRLHHKKKKKKKVICGIAGLIARDASAGSERKAREIGGEMYANPNVQGDGRDLGSGIAGFLLGTFVGSKLGSGGFGFSQSQTQTQTQVQVQGPPIRPVGPAIPAPVHEDYDEVEGEYPVGGPSLCQQLQQRPDPGPLDSHFPLIHGILAAGQKPYRPAYYRPPPQPVYHKPGGSLLYHYFKPWVGLFFK